MKIALIFPNLYETEKYVTESIHPPLSLGYLAACLEKIHSVKVFDAAAGKMSISVLINKLEDFRPEIIGITSNISTALMCQITAKKCKSAIPSAKIVIGGPWATVNYQFLLQRNIADIIVIGEAEETIVELLHTLECGNSIEKIKGIAYKNGPGEIIKTLPRDLIENLDTIPFPAWHLFPKSNKYNFNRRGRHFYPIITSRGCPYECIHCTKAVFGTKMRYRSIKNVIEEIKFLRRNFHADEILLVDDNFTLNLHRAIRILTEIARLPFKLKIQFSNGIRADIMNDHLLDAMRYAGVYRISLGIESGSQEILDKIGKHLSLAKVHMTAVSLQMRPYFISAGFFMLGHPYDTPKTVLATIRLALKLDLDYSHFFKNIVIPGTKQYDIINDLKGKTFIKQDMGLPGGFNRPSPTFETPNLSIQFLEYAYNFAYKSFYLRPRKMLEIINKVRSWYEFAWIFNFSLNILRFIYSHKGREIKSCEKNKPAYI